MVYSQICRNFILLMIDITIPLLINKLLKWRKINKHINKRVRGHQRIFIILYCNKNTKTMKKIIRIEEMMIEKLQMVKIPHVLV